MRPKKLIISFLLLTSFATFNSCDKINVEVTFPSRTHKKDVKPDFPVPVGCIRGFFGDEYLTFDQHIERVQPIDSFSNCYFFGQCKGSESNQINLIRCDSTFVLAIYIIGYPLDSLPPELPVTPEYGKYTEIQFYPSQAWNSTDPGHYSLASFYGKNVFITDIKNDTVTGTFDGYLYSSTGETINVSEGEFKLALFRKDMSCED